MNLPSSPLGPGSARVVSVGYEVKVGSLLASHDKRKANAGLLSLHTHLGMGQVGGMMVKLAPFGVEAPKVGDEVTVRLDGGAGVETAFVGQVRSVHSAGLSLELRAEGPLSRLARLDVEGVYEGQTVGEIVKSLLTQIKAEGTLESGPSLLRYMLRLGPRALRHVQRLAELCGFELWETPEGKVMMRPLVASEPVQTFSWQQSMLELALSVNPLHPDGVTVVGEGAASQQGQDKAHWLVVDPAPVTAQTRLQPAEKPGNAPTVKEGEAGSAPQRFEAAVLRTGELARGSAQAQALRLSMRPITGYALVPGNPALKPSDFVAFEGFPKQHALVEFSQVPVCVRAVHHRLDATSGFITRLEF